MQSRLGTLPWRPVHRLEYFTNEEGPDDRASGNALRSSTGGGGDLDDDKSDRSQKHFRGSKKNRSRSPPHRKDRRSRGEYSSDEPNDSSSSCSVYHRDRRDKIPRRTRNNVTDGPDDSPSTATRNWSAIGSATKFNLVGDGESSISAPS